MTSDDFYDILEARREEREEWDDLYGADEPDNPDEEAWWDYAEKRAMELEAEEHAERVIVSERYL